MAGTDPKKDREAYDADEDPLVELARIVSEDGGFSSRMTRRPRVEHTRPTVDRDNLSSDLEAELLQELETSFSSRQAPPAAEEPPAPARRPVTARRPEPVEEVAEDGPAPVYSRRFVESSAPQPKSVTRPPIDAGDPDDLLRSIEEQLSQFDQRIRSHGLAGGSEEPVAEDARGWAAEEVAAEEFQEVDEEEEAAEEPVADWDEAAEAELPRSEYRFRGPAGPGWQDQEEDEDFEAEDEPLETPTSAADAEPEMDFRPRRMSARDLPEYRAAEPDAEEDFDTEDAEEAYSPPPPRAEPEGRRAPKLAALEDELTQDFDSAYADEEPDDSDVLDEEPEAAREPAVAAAAVVTPAPAMQPPPRPAAPARPAAQQKRSRKGLMTAAAVLIVVLAGGAGAWYLRSFDVASSGPPPVIAAPEGPVKIAPAETQTAENQDTVGEAVYNRVAGRTAQTEENVVESAEEPKEIARIVLPNTQSSTEGGPPATVTIEEAASEEPQPATPSMAAGQDGQGDFGPRRVPTYVVRPDGTIVATADAGEPNKPDLSAQEMATAQTKAMEPKAVQTVTIDEPRTAGSPAPQPAAQIASAPEPAEPAPAAEAPAQDETAMAAAEQPEEPAPAVAAEPAEEPAPEPQVAMAPAPEPAPAPAPTAASGYLVQVASTTSQDTAESTFAAMKRRYPSVLGKLDANIQRADLGAKGVYYRVRVGPWAERSDAIAVCEALQAAGGDCFVAR